MPQVSIVIPHYRRLSLLCEAIDSVVAQTFTDWELWVVDDGSVDNHGDWGRLELEQRYAPWIAANRLKIIEIEHCGCPGAVRNEGAKRATGHWLAFLDSDDLWLPMKLEKQVAYMEAHPEFRWSHTRELWKHNERLISQSKQRYERLGDIFPDALQKCIIGPSTSLIERNFFLSVNGFNDSMEVAEDYELWLRLLTLAPIGYIDEALGIKRAGDWEQLSFKYGEITSFHLQGLENYLQWAEATQCKTENIRQAYRHLQSKIKIYLKGCEKRGKIAECEKWQKKALEIESRAKRFE